MDASKQIVCPTCGRAGLQLLSIGRTVKLAGDVQAVITSINISDKHHVTYKCTWWNGLSRQSEWVESFELEPMETERADLGFIVPEMKR
jgi:uncharacterized protein YodC (DUF2158 family)